MPYVSVEAQREYQRLWMQRRRAEFFDFRVCHDCETSDDLELHHIDPSIKVSHKIWSWTEIRRSEELAKCQVLCTDCHKNKRVIEHGGGKAGKYRCKCSPCKTKKAEYMKKYKKLVKGL